MQELTELVTLSNGKAVTTSRKFAKYFNKRHANVLQLFQTRIMGKHSAEFIELNFQLNEYRDSRGRSLPELQMTKNGFIALATKMHGAEAWQERFIAAFDMLAEQLESMAFTLWNRRLQLETRDATSAAKASIGSRLMLDRKKELPEIRAERAFLINEMQPSLQLQ